MQPQKHLAWKINNTSGTPIAYEVSSVPIETDDHKLHEQDGIRTFEMDKMEIILANNRGKMENAFRVTLMRC